MLDSTADVHTIIATRGPIELKTDEDGRAWLRITDGTAYLSVGFELTEANEQQVLTLADHIVWKSQCEAHDQEEAAKELQLALKLTNR